jgi:hypothetical protein
MMSVTHAAIAAAGKSLIFSTADPLTFDAPEGLEFAFV